MNIRKQWIWLAVFGLIGAGLLQFALSWLDKPWGAQQVAMRPADEICGLSGELRFCVYKAAQGTNGDVLYHLHGRGLDERIWNDDTYYTAMLQAEWGDAGTKPPTVVTLSYGPTWLLTPKGKRAQSGLLDDLMGRLPEIEAQIGSPRNRLLLGESMGGLNVLIAGLSHPRTFSKVAALCPGVYVNSPFDDVATAGEAIRRTGAKPKVALGVWLLARRYVADEQEWLHISPIKLLEQVRAPVPELYISNGLYDAYGNFEGSQRFARTAQARGVRTEWRPTYGGHCATDITSLARFLVSPTRTSLPRSNVRSTLLRQSTQWPISLSSVR